MISLFRMIELVGQKVLAAALIVGLSLGFGFLPAVLAKKYLQHPQKSICSTYKEVFAALTKKVFAKLTKKTHTKHICSNHKKIFAAHPKTYLQQSQKVSAALTKKYLQHSHKNITRPRKVLGHSCRKLSELLVKSINHLFMSP